MTHSPTAHFGTNAWLLAYLRQAMRAQKNYALQCLQLLGDYLTFAKQCLPIF